MHYTVAECIGAVQSELKVASPSHRRNLLGYERYPCPHFLDWGTVPIFQDEKVKNLLLSAVNRGDLRRLNYNKTVFGRGSAYDPQRELMMLSQLDPRV